jgi:hypothetical protein
LFSHQSPYAIAFLLLAYTLILVYSSLSLPLHFALISDHGLESYDISS